MDEEVGRVVRGLHGEQQLICFDPLHGESCHPDELNESNRNSYLLMGDAISVLEKLAAENELLKARCEAAEKDMKKAQACACIICKHHVPSSGRKYRCVIYEDRIDRWGDGEVLMCGRFEWRGQREGETE